MNKAIISGRLGADPEVRYVQSGTPVANFRVATNESYTDNNGQRVERAEWHRCVAWGRIAKACGEYLYKGREVTLEGKLRTREWTDRDGNKRYTTEIVASNVVFHGGKKQDAKSHQNAQAHEESQVSDEFTSDLSEDDAMAAAAAEAYINNLPGEG